MWECVSHAGACVFHVGAYMFHMGVCSIGACCVLCESVCSMWGMLLKAGVLEDFFPNFY